MNKVNNVAHRGARSLAPENTMVAFHRGLAEKADLWETDIRPTIDGELVIFHDETLNRTTDAEKKFPKRELFSSGFTLKELKELDAGSWFVETDPFGQIASGALSKEEVEAFRGEKIPTLEEALIFTRDANFPVNLELKKLSDPITEFPMVDRVLETIKRVGINEELIIFSSFYHEWLREIRQKSPQFVLQALVEDIKEVHIDLENPEFDTYNADQSLITDEDIHKLVSKNITVNLYTVNDLAQMKRFIKAGVTNIITDFPQLLGKLL